MKNKMRFSNWIWGTFMLLAATFVLANHLGGFVEIGIGSIIAAALAVAFLVQCIAHLSLSPLPIPLAVLYIIFQKPFGFPELQPWTLLLAALFATIGLSILLPGKLKDGAWVGVHWNGHSTHTHRPPVRTENSDNENNPSVSVSFGSISRYLHSDCLETAQLYCNCGALEVFFDKAQLSPNGAEMNINCTLGGIEIFVPKHWRVIDNLNCTLGGVDIDNRFAVQEENAPQLTLVGSVLLGGIEIRFI